MSGHYRAYIDAIRRAREEGPEAFQTWFNAGASASEALCAGYWDFAALVATPQVRAHLRRPHEATVLEIGYGGGRLLNAACSFFGEAIGIDVHEEAETVRAFLENQGKSNFRLLRGSGDSIDLEPETVDFVYSFIVLQHLPSFATLARYVEEASRCLKKGGVAQLYFGRFGTAPFAAQLKYVRRGWIELRGVPVNATSLVARKGAVKRVARSAGLSVVACGPPSRPGAGARGGQSYVTLVKS